MAQRDFLLAAGEGGGFLRREFQSLLHGALDRLPPLVVRCRARDGDAGDDIGESSVPTTFIAAATTQSRYMTLK